MCAIQLHNTINIITALKKGKRQKKKPGGSDTFLPTKMCAAFPLKTRIEFLQNFYSPYL